MDLGREPLLGLGIPGQVVQREAEGVGRLQREQRILMQPKYPPNIANDDS